MGIFFLLLFGGGLLAPTAWGMESDGNIRVLIARKSGQLTIQGQELALRDLSTGHWLFKNQRLNSLTLKQERGHLMMVGAPKVWARSLVITAGGGTLAINGRKYHNRLHIFPRPNGSIWAINELPMESYLAGLINCEVFSNWPMEALKAQAVVARTYATFQQMARKGEPYDVDSTVADQVYEGKEKEDERSHRAARQTAGELLLYGGRPIFSVYHACCGGRTEDAHMHWTLDYPYLRSVPCNFCLDSPHFVWNYQVSTDSLAKTLGMVGLWGSQILDIGILERSESKRVLLLSIQTERERMKISGKEFRRVLGYDFIRSTHFILKKEREFLLFSGLGWGHGVGLCQWGSRGMAENGEAYRSILQYYYRNVQIGRMPR